MPYVVKIIPMNSGDIEGYYTGRIPIFAVDGVAVPTYIEDLKLAKIYKQRKRAENAVNKILKESTYVTNVEIVEIK
ncbi:hypothetical protein ABD91_00635 [Lysinibacillus sphaericus]|uniref:hypothetical protein n=1 Tax=Lysinibacillus sphaericus TaxID=1421 RepID=UPI0018CC7E96|nr:hypothetical protein [Lysinibacillus sphaericus]MBG9689434.1 hypothetical protein [Lysinibacillus sphaericus]